jgi:hypothetical protein
MTNQQSTKLAQPRVGSFHNPATLIATQFTSIFVAPLRTILPVRHDQVDAAFLQSLPQGIGIIRRIRNHSRRFLSRTASTTWVAEFCQRGLRKLNFVRRGTFQPNSQRNTLTVDQYLYRREDCCIRLISILSSLDKVVAWATFFSTDRLPRPCISRYNLRRGVVSDATEQLT